MSGKCEIVGITAKEGSLLFGRANNPHIGIFLVAVEPVLPALIQRHHVGTQACLVETLLLYLCLLGLSRIKGLLIRHARFDRAANTVRDIFHRNQNVQLEIRSLYLLGLGLRIKTFFHVILLCGRYLLKLAQGDVVIRYDEAIRTHE